MRWGREGNGKENGNENENERKGEGIRILDTPSSHTLFYSIILSYLSQLQTQRRVRRDNHYHHYYYSFTFIHIQTILMTPDSSFNHPSLFISPSSTNYTRSDYP